MNQEPTSAEDKARLVALVKKNQQLATEASRQAKAAAETLQNYADDMSRLTIIADSDAALDMVRRPQLETLTVELARDNDVLTHFTLARVPEIHNSLHPITLGGPTGVMSIVTADAFSTPHVPHEAVSPFQQYLAAQKNADDSRGSITACKKHMKRLGCERSPSPAGNTNLGYLEAAWSSFRSPVHNTHSALAPLIAMRECINNTLGCLRGRLMCGNIKGKQDAVVVSALHTASRQTMLPEYVAALAKELSGLLERLSGDGKNATLSRDATLSLLSAATNWLNRFLGQLDESKLRPS